MTFIFTVCACVLLLTAAIAKGDYKKAGGTLTLTPDISSFPDRVKTILWKVGKNKVAEFDPDFSPDVDYYGGFRGRTTLDTKTGHLVINQLQTSDTGVYSLELNSKPQEPTYTISVIKEVPEPKITETCETPKTSCTLSCEGDAPGAEPVTYSWRGGEKVLNVTDKKLTVTVTDHQIKTYTCQMKNPVSEKSSPPHKNPFYPDPDPIPVGGIVAGVLVPLVALAAAGGFIYQRKYKSVRLAKEAGENNEATVEENEGRNEPAGPNDNLITEAEKDKAAV